MPHHILVADDDECFRTLMFHVLKSWDFGVETVQNGLEAQEAIASNPPDLVICDVQMPKMGGEELCRILKSRPETADIPIVLVSGQIDVAETLGRVGADGALNKPFDLDRLRGLIEQLAAGSLQHIAA